MENEPLIAPAADRESALVRDDKLELKVWLRLLTCANLIENRVRVGLRESFDITLPRFDVLAQLDRAPDGLTMSELSGHLMVSNGNITGLVDRLVGEGLISRVPAPDDRRRNRVKLTAAGKRVFDTMTPVHERWVDDLLKGLSRNEMADLLALLAKLKRSVQASDSTNQDKERA